MARACHMDRFVEDTLAHVFKSYGEFVNEDPANKLWSVEDRRHTQLTSQKALSILERNGHGFQMFPMWPSVCDSFFVTSVFVSSRRRMCPTSMSPTAGFASTEYLYAKHGV